jgi:nucleoid-associated protein YgaU
MGMFDFLANVGANILSRGNEADKVKELLQRELGAQIQDLSVTFDDGTVFLTGSCDSQATQEKAILLAGNVKGVSQVNDDHLSFPEPEKKEKVDFYTIKSGDTLSKIAKAYYGDPMKYPEIFEANREVIKNPDLIYPGQTIRIPTLKGG